MVEMKNLQTERLILRTLDESHAEKVLEYHLLNQDFLSAWEPVRDDSFYTLESTQEMLKKDLQNLQQGMSYKLWIFKKEDSEQNIIGAISLNHIIRGAFQSCLLGYKLAGTEINQGYMTEALKIAIDFAFTDLKLHRIEANIMPRNLPSLRVVEKLNFYYEGFAKKYLKINGKWEDHLHMVKLNEMMEEI